MSQQLENSKTKTIQTITFYFLNKVEKFHPSNFIKDFSLVVAHYIHTFMCIYVLDNIYVFFLLPFTEGK